MFAARLGIVALFITVSCGSTAGLWAADSTKFPPVITVGEQGELIFDLHATLNDYFSKRENRQVNLPDKSSVEGSSFFTPDGEKVRVPTRWVVEGSPPRVRLPEKPIESFGIYGEETYALVMLFQIREGLPPTGEVDAVTLQHLKPLQPASRPLLNLIMQRVSPTNKMGASLWAALFILLVSVVVYCAARYAANLLDRHLKKRLARKESQFADRRMLPYLQQARFFQALAHVAPATFVYGAHWVYPDYWKHEINSVPLWQLPETFLFWNQLFARIGLSCIIISLGFVCLSVVKAIQASMTAGDEEGVTALWGIMRFVRGSIRTVGVILIGAALTGVNPLTILGSLGVFVTIFLVLFRDSLMGLAASFQIVANNFVKVGDWIEMPKFDADGYVTSMSVSTIKVQNFDKTIASIPTHAVLTDSFRNWRGMQEAGGRRIKRSIVIDMNTIKPCNAELVERFENIDLLRDYIQSKRHALKSHLLEHNVTISPVNGRWLTNIGTFRVYAEAYLRAHPEVHAEQTCMVRHLAPNAEGLPLEIYCFSVETSLIEFESIQADIFDHLVSVLPEFDLRVFQNPREFDYDHVEQKYLHRINDQALAVANVEGD